MTDDPTRPPDLKAIWKDQRLEIPAVAVETVRRNAKRLQRRRLWTLIRETLGVILLVVMAGFYVRIRSLQPGPLDLSDAVTEAGMGLLVLYMVFYAWRLFVLFRPRRVPDDTVACLAFHRRELERQRDLVRRLRWALIPLPPLEFLILVGLWIGPPAPGRAPWLHHLTILAAGVFMLETFVLAWLWSLYRADRWQDRIDELDALGVEERPMNAIGASLAAAAVLAAVPAPAPADPTGDWTGTLHTRTIDIAAGLEIRRTPEGYQAIYDVISQGIWGVHLRRTQPQTPLAFAATNLSGTLTFTWDPAAKDWICTWREKGRVYATTLKRGVIPPAPALSPRDRIALPAMAAVMILEAVGIARLLQLRRRRRMRQRAA